MGNGEIVVYQPDEITRLEVKVERETVWLTQEQIAALFGVKRPAITKHIRNIFGTQELEEISVCSILERTASDGKVYMTQYYNLDMILSIGYRVNSISISLVVNFCKFRQISVFVCQEALICLFSVSVIMDVFNKKPILILGNFSELLICFVSAHLYGFDILFHSIESQFPYREISVAGNSKAYKYDYNQFFFIIQIIFYTSLKFIDMFYHWLQSSWLSR